MSDDAFVCDLAKEKDLYFRVFDLAKEKGIYFRLEANTYGVTLTVAHLRGANGNLRPYLGSCPRDFDDIFSAFQRLVSIVREA
jgi:hypothetical protein